MHTLRNRLKRPWEAVTNLLTLEPKDGLDAWQKIRVFQTFEAIQNLADSYHIMKEAAQFAQSNLAIKYQNFVEKFGIAKALDKVRLSHERGFFGTDEDISTRRTKRRTTLRRLTLRCLSWAHFHRL